MRQPSFRPGLLLLTFAAATALGLMSGCRTTANREASQVYGAGEPLGVLAKLTLGKEESQALYLKMLAVEVSAGVTVPKEQVHQTRGVFECRREGAIQSCRVRVRLMDRELSGAQALNEELTEQIQTFLVQARFELAREKLLLADVACDYLGKKSPPYDLEDVTCAATLPRILDEAILVDKAAEEMVEGIRGETALAAPIAKLEGALICRWLEGARQTPCFVRSVAAGVAQEKVVELSARHSSPIARKLMQATIDHLKIEQGPQTARAVTPPSEIMASLTCLVDNRGLESQGARRFVCTARI